MYSDVHLDCRKIQNRLERTRCKQNAGRELSKSWIKRLAFGPDKSNAELVQVWLGIFAVNWRELPNPSWLNRQIGTIEKFQFGTYPELLGNILKEPAILHSLNGFQNHRKNPNENLGREVLELFSIGEGNYSEEDVKQVALALTGFRLNKNNEVVIVPRRNDPGPHKILGKKANFDVFSLATWLGQQPSTSTYISKRIWRRWIGIDPSQERLNEFATNWYMNDLSLPWLYTNLPKQPEAIQCAELGLRFLDPINVVARSLKLLGSQHSSAFQLAFSIQSLMGQPPFAPPSVKGWPYGEQWITSRWMAARKRGLLRLLADEEVWDSRSLPLELKSDLVPFPPINLKLPAKPSRENIALLFSDPSWQFSGPIKI